VQVTPASSGDTPFCGEEREPRPKRRLPGDPRVLDGQKLDGIATQRQPASGAANGTDNAADIGFFSNGQLRC